jgi:4-amino-4-deoxy-L-arabinose transferase-like glycosyltransferase
MTEMKQVPTHPHSHGRWPRPAVSRAHLGLVLICLLFVTLAWVYGLVLPAFENLDEIEHFSAVHFVAETGSLPVHDPAIQGAYRYRQEASQPPLYYILMGALTRWLDLPTADTNDYLVSNPFVACGPSDNPYNKHTLYHDPALEGLGGAPWQGALLTLHLLRALSPLLQLITVLTVFAIARLLAPQRPSVAPLAAALTAFNPQFLLVASGVNNDNLVTPLATLGLYLALLSRYRGLSLRRSLLIGFLAGLAGLSKLSGLLLLPFVGLILLEMAWRSQKSDAALPRTPLSAVLGHGLLLATVALVLSGWWFVRNWQLYGDLTALAPMLELVGRRQSPVFPLHESGLMFRSFWGQLSCSFFGDTFYLFFGLLTAAGLSGLVLGLYQSWRGGWSERRSWVGMFWLVLWFGVIVVAWLRWDLLTPAPGGRLLFPAIGSTSILLAYGLLEFWPASWRRHVVALIVLLLAGVALVTLRWEIAPLFASPPTYDRASRPEIRYPLNATFTSPDPEGDPLIGLLGYDAATAGEGSELGVSVLWEALEPLAKDYVLAIQLTSPVPGDDTLRFNYNTWPGRGNYPTTAWLPGQVIADRYHFRLPPSEGPTQAWQLLLAFYEKESGERLPVRVGTQDVGRGLVLTTLRLPGHPPDCPQEAALLEPVRYGAARDGTYHEMVALTAGLVRPVNEEADSDLQVLLCWQTLAPIPQDYTVFVHLYGAGGELIATGDGPPMSGAFPTRLWEPGDRVRDPHVIPLSDSDVQRGDGYRVGVGLYDLATGDRLQAFQGDQPVQDNAFLLDMGQVTAGAIQLP